MHAAIKVLEDTIFIRRLQERELEHDQDGAERLVALRADIASLERGLRSLTAEEETNKTLGAPCSILARQQ